jgi:hypothetical protein
MIARGRALIDGAGWVALVVAVGGAAGALLPLRPELLGLELDEAFGAVLHFAAAHPADVRPISTFGPLGFVFYAIYLPETFAWLFGLRLALASATGWAIGWIGYEGWRSPWGAALALGACAPFLASPDVWFLTVPMLAVLFELCRRPPPTPLRVALGGAIGCAALIKFSVFLAAVATLVPISACSLLTRRRVPVTATAAASTGALAWLASGHGPASFVTYLDWSLREISPGYAAAMQLPPDETLLKLAIAASVAVLVAAAGLATSRLPRRLPRAAIALALGAWLFLLFKAGFVRADLHVTITAGGLVVGSVLLALLMGPTRRGLACAMLVAALPAWLWWHAGGLAAMYFRPIWPREAWRRIADAPQWLHPAALAKAHATRVALLRRVRLPELAGTVDMYAFSQGPLLAYGMAYRPRPVFHSYMAYTPRLAHANANFLLRERAPDWLLFQHAPIDERFPTLDDAPSWPLLLTRYEQVARHGRFAVLRRRPTPLEWELEPLSTVTASTGERIPLPTISDGELLWARLRVEEPFQARLRSLLLSAPIVLVRVELRDGGSKSFRLVPALAADGFLLSPLIDSDAHFSLLMARSPELLQRNAIVAVQVTVDPGIGGAPEPCSVSIDLLRLRVDGAAPVPLAR